MGCQTVLRLGAAGLVTPADSQHGNKDSHICVRRCSTKSVHTKIVPVYVTYVAVAKPSLCQALSPWQTVTQVVTGLAPAPFRSFYNTSHSLIHKHAPIHCWERLRDRILRPRCYVFNEKQWKRDSASCFSRFHPQCLVMVMLKSSKNKSVPSPPRAVCCPASLDLEACKVLFSAHNMWPACPQSTIK